MVFCFCKFDDALTKDSKIVQTKSMKKFDNDTFLADVVRI